MIVVDPSCCWNLWLIHSCVRTAVQTYRTTRPLLQSIDSAAEDAIESQVAPQKGTEITPNNAVEEETTGTAQKRYSFLNNSSYSKITYTCLFNGVIFTALAASLKTFQRPYQRLQPLPVLQGILFNSTKNCLIPKVYIYVYCNKALCKVYVYTVTR